MTNQGLALEPEIIDVTIERLVYQSPETGYVVLKAVSEDGTELSCVGQMAAPVPGEKVRLFGRWEVHARFGRQFRFRDYQVLREAEPEAVGRYLADAIPGIGPELARRIVKHFGSDTIKALDAGEERLREVPGIGPKKAAAIAQTWQQHRHIHELMVTLRSIGVNPRLAARIYETYGTRAIEVVERQPYRLARDFRGVGFATADRIAQRAGIPPDDPQRIEAALLHVLREAAAEGHLFLPSDELVRQASSLTGLPADLVDRQMQQLAEDGDIVIEVLDEQAAVYLPGALECERRVARLLKELARTQSNGLDEQVIRDQLTRFEVYSDMQLNEEQTGAVVATLRHPVSIITGGPGTGKTTVIRAIVWLWENTGRKVALCAPTGRAAKRAEELSGHEAQTIHRLLQYRPDGAFLHGPHDPLPFDVVIVDEASMVDMWLAYALLRALKPGTHVVLVGDANQLPPVGPGAFFAEAVASGVLTVTRLTKIYRQAERSLIVTNAHRIIAGQPPILPTPRSWHGEDMVWVDVEWEAKATGTTVAHQDERPDSLAAQQIALQKVSNAVTRSLPRMGFQPSDIQVISPMHKGLLGVDNLNPHLQALLNPPRPDKPEVRRGATVFRLGDRVLQKANNYDKGVFNGEIGQVADIWEDGMAVDFAIGRIDYDRTELDQLELAYALTVHKSQGSEYPAVVIVLHSSHYIMLERNLLYTALTRAERMAILVGDRRGLWKALRTGRGRQRYTRLAARLKGKLPEDWTPLEEGGVEAPWVEPD
ncbi:MAG: ATP-dependent RecD-like DNA helicase [Armatimonadetes bacterium]|nr:ATP-dependent RecD-like DNA helicase [Armatimonadota bacterium]